jgi:hypothetical protein
MKRTTKLGAFCMVGGLAFASAAWAQDASAQNQETKTTQQTTEVTDEGMTKTTKTTTVEGKVVRYEPGKTIVVLGPDNREVSYVLSTSATVPAEVQVGRVVVLNTEPSTSGPVTVTRVTVRSMTSDGKMKTETQTQSTDASGTMTKSTETKTTDITGTISAIEPGKSVTIVLPDKKTVVYTLDTSSVVPSDVAVGKTYTIQTTRTTANGPLLVKKITTTTTTKKTNPE